MLAVIQSKLSFTAKFVSMVRLERRTQYARSIDGKESYADRRKYESMIQRFDNWNQVGCKIQTVTRRLGCGEGI